jgi:NTP pyrophosphatase (non-canonical NTP hydrolase)
MGLNGEAGECIDIVKKSLFQGHEIDREHLIEELGDTAWYIAVSCQALGVTLEDCLNRNIEKLKKRYPDGFKTKDSLARSSEDI